MHMPRRSTAVRCCPSSRWFFHRTASRRGRKEGDVTADARHSGEGSDKESNAGEMLRPEAVVLPENAVVPELNVVRPAPNRFTHELLVDEPYRFDPPGPTGEPDGVLPAGTPVVLLVEGPDRCRVVDGAGLYIEVRRASLRKLRES